MHQPQHTTGDGEKNAFGEQLADDTCTACAQCRANRELAPTACGAHQQEVCHVGAGDEQDQPDRPEQHKQRRAHVADDGVAQRLNCKAALLVGLRECAQELRIGKFHLRVGLRQRYAGFEHCGDLEEVSLVGTVRLKLEGQPDLGFGIGRKFAAKNAHDRVPLIAERQGLADDIRIAAEPALPQRVAQHHNFAAVLGVFLRSEGAAQHHGCAKDAEIALGDVNAVDQLGALAGDVEPRPCKVVGRNVFEDSGLALVDLELRNGGDYIASLR